MLRTLPAESAQLVLTSPPFALTRKKAYGNAQAEDYLEWLRPFVREIRRVLRPDGSFVLDLGGTWVPGKPVKNVYQYEVLLALVHGKASERFFLAQDFFWLNRARLPNPVQWVNVQRIRVTDAVNVVWWLSKNGEPFADNRAVLRPYSLSMLKLLKDGDYNAGARPSEWKIGATSFNRNNGGSIPSNFVDTDETAELGYPTNLLAGSNTASGDPYQMVCREVGLKAHPARFPIQFAEFFVQFLSKPGDLVIDPFSGSNTTGWAAERKSRRWLSIEVDAQYLVPSAARFGRDIRPLLRQFDLEGGGQRVASKS